MPARMCVVFFQEMTTFSSQKVTLDRQMESVRQMSQMRETTELCAPEEQHPFYFTCGHLSQNKN